MEALTFFQTFPITSRLVLRTTLPTARNDAPQTGKQGRPKQLEAGLQRRNEVAAKVEPQARPPSAMRTTVAEPIPVKEQL